MASNVIQRMQGETMQDKQTIISVRDSAKIIESAQRKAKKLGTNLSVEIRGFLRRWIAEPNTRDTPKDANT